MNQIINVIQIILSIALSILIFLQLQENKQQTNLNAAPANKRGWEKITFTSTLFLLFVFTITSLLRTII